MIKKVFTTQHSTICIVWLIADKFEYYNPNDKKQKKIKRERKTRWRTAEIIRENLGVAQIGSFPDLDLKGV